MVGISGHESVPADTVPRLKALDYMLLMDAMKTLAKRLNLSRVMLTVFGGNTPAEKLYVKAGFVECGKLPGWLQEGYINERYMVLQLD